MAMINIEAEFDLQDLMGQVFRNVTYGVMLDLLLDEMEEDLSCPIATVFPRECKKLIEQIAKRVERHTAVPEDEPGETVGRF